MIVGSRKGKFTCPRCTSSWSYKEYLKDKDMWKEFTCVCGLEIHIEDICTNFEEVCKNVLYNS